MRLAGLDGEGQAVKRRPAAGIGERDVAELDLPFRLAERARIGPVDDGGRRIE